VFHVQPAGTCTGWRHLQHEGAMAGALAACVHGKRFLISMVHA
jgi:hypothetical protein